MDEMLSGHIECSESVSVREVLGSVGVRVHGPWTQVQMMVELTLPADLLMGRLDAAFNELATSIGASIHIALCVPPEIETPHEVH